jgi:4'-phosphopantetheinyl transferase
MTDAHAWLDDRERTAAARLRSSILATEFVRTRALVRSALSQVAPRALHPADLRFGRSRFGRPRVVSPRFATALHFSVAKTRGLIVCAVALHRGLGADVESIDAGPSMEVARRFFGAAERNALCRLPEGRQQRTCFLELWTLAEAYGKALGLGLRAPLTRLRFQVSPSGHVCVPGEPFRRHHFSIHRPSHEHVLAIALAASSNRAEPPRVELRRLEALTPPQQ